MNVAMRFTLLMCIAILFSACSRRGNEPGGLGGQKVAAPDSSLGWNVLPSRYEERQGKYLFTRYCAVCHGETGAGDGFNAYNLDPKPHSFADSAYMAQVSENSLYQVIAQGGRGVNKSVLMPPYAHTLRSVQIKYLTAYIRELAQAGK